MAFEILPEWRNFAKSGHTEFRLSCMCALTVDQQKRIRLLLIIEREGCVILVKMFRKQLPNSCSKILRKSLDRYLEGSLVYCRTYRVSSVYLTRRLGLDNVCRLFKSIFNTYLQDYKRGLGY